ncbi:MAG: Gfo/Idh/MocA family oxidoreductase [Clostridiaceae bacterium]|jgi:predicted dehydrogenase|nr:Gfo/Idh/MocA family oxidoreductase [Clostridiaceae bacterium]
MKLIIIGTGSRGRVYARLAQEYGAKIVAVADPNEEHLLIFADKFNIPKNGLYKSWEEVFAVEKFADAVIVSTPDRVHYGPAMAALEKGYHVLLEKPMSPVEQECRNMVEKSREKDLIFMVCHVLRYAPFYEKLKEIIEEGRIGQIINLQHTENVAYWHFAHSFVRGIFRNEAVSSPWILAKSCHDLDIITYLMDKKCKSVISKGNLMHFKKENSPEGAPEYCLDKCPHEKTCQYFAPALYLKQITNVTWPSDVISVDTSFASRFEALKKGPYGRCVYRCDNDMVDHQSAIFEMEDGSTATFNMIGFSSENTRTIRIYGTKGDIRAHQEKNEIEIHDFLTGRKELVEIDKSAIRSSHGGGDERLLKDFLDSVSGKPSEKRTSASNSLQSHLMAFAAEKSRKEGRTVEIYY